MIATTTRWWWRLTVWSSSQPAWWSTQTSEPHYHTRPAQYTMSIGMWWAINKELEITLRNFSLSIQVDWKWLFNGKPWRFGFRNSCWGEMCGVKNIILMFWCSSSIVMHRDSIRQQPIYIGLGIKLFLSQLPNICTPRQKKKTKFALHNRITNCKIFFYKMCINTNTLF